VVTDCCELANHRDTENAEVAQRRNDINERSTCNSVLLPALPGYGPSRAIARAGGVGHRLAVEQPHATESAVALVEMAAAHWTERSQWEPAATALQQFVTRAPGCIAALVRLVEVAVDGDLGATASHAQEMLADAYLASGAISEGLAIAEDLAAREPNNPVHASRVRQAQEMLDGRPSNPAAGAKAGHTILPFRSAAAS